MLKFREFEGMNNSLPPYRLKPTELQEAINIDVGPYGNLSRRPGYTLEAAGCFTQPWQTPTHLLGVSRGDLISYTPDETRVLYQGLGPQRVWYCNLPDGRTTFSNGLINGVTDGVYTTSWGVPIPTHTGHPIVDTGGLPAGKYRLAVTHTRLLDGREGPPAFSEPFDAEGGILFTDLPLLPGHKTNIYLTASNGTEFFHLGHTELDVFHFAGTPNDLTVPLKRQHYAPMPVGTVTALWRSRLLVAKGNELWASQPYLWELCDPRRDFKQFSAPITAVGAVEDGVYVGTTKGLYFLAGDAWESLEFRTCIEGPVVLGSCVATQAEYLKPREGGNYKGPAIVCIADREIVFGYASGSVWRVTGGRYKTDVQEVYAAVRPTNGYDQYIAVPV